MHPKRIHLALVIFLLMLQGCITKGPNQRSAKATLSAAMTQWVDGVQTKEIENFRPSYHSKPLSFSIRKISPAKPDFPLDIMADYPDSLHKDDATAFDIVLDVEFLSKAGTSLEKVLTFQTIWIRELDAWVLIEH